MLEINQITQIPGNAQSYCVAFGESGAGEVVVLGFLDDSILKLPVRDLRAADHIRVGLHRVNNIISVPEEPNLLLLVGRCGLSLYDLETDFEFDPVPRFAEAVYVADQIGSDMRFLCACEDENIWEVNVSLGTAKIVCQTGEGTTSISVHPNGKDIVYTFEMDGCVMVSWKLNAPARDALCQEFQFENLRAKFSPCGNYYVCVDHYVRAFRFVDRGNLWNYSALEGFTQSPKEDREARCGWTTPVFSPDSKSVFCGSANGSIYMWNVDRGEVFCLEGVHDGRIRALALNADGSLLASLGEDRNLKLWNVSCGITNPT